ncbi:ribbon-helix-helix protein, CopG family [Methylobacterium radiotolerans]|uniref:ribbon-helix-helix protein, CopG family n=1 Tax=Methylobacterium radiotolerans TaxID=31998 RepID=UPI001194F884|nr:hypothetical protein MRA01_62660 [Methylobacterium radiotolerans]
MVHRPPYLPSRDLLTENLQVGVPLDLKRALTDAARREGKSVASVVREAVADALGHGDRPQDPAGARREVR